MALQFALGGAQIFIYFLHLRLESVDRKFISVEYVGGEQVRRNRDIFP